MLLGGRQSAAYWKKSLGGAFGILAEEVAGGRRGERDNPEDVVQQQVGDRQADGVQQQGGDHQADVVQQQGGDHQADVVLLLEDVLVLLEGEAQGAAGREGAERTGGIATEKALGGTTGGGGGGRPSLRLASTWPRVPATRPPSLLRERAITIGAVFIMLRRVPVM